jgi:large subunit ribosomal protein L13
MELILKTFIPKQKEIDDKKWWLVDAGDQRLGRLATQVAILLRGKHKPTFTPHLDMGDFVVVINAEKLVLTGRKMEQKTYFRHSTYPGGQTITPVKELMAREPELVVKKAIWGMLPHNALGRRRIRKLKVYRSTDHPHQAQQPMAWDLS